MLPRYFALELDRVPRIRIVSFPYPPPPSHDHFFLHFFSSSRNTNSWSPSCRPSVSQSQSELQIISTVTNRWPILDTFNHRSQADSCVECLKMLLLLLLLLRNISSQTTQHQQSCKLIETSQKSYSDAEPLPLRHDDHLHACESSSWLWCGLTWDVQVIVQGESLPE